MTIHSVESSQTSSALLRPVFPILLGSDVELVDVRRLVREEIVNKLFAGSVSRHHHHHH